MNPFLTKERPKLPHRCAQVAYEHGKPLEETPITCECGWTGRLFEAEAHGLKVSRAVDDWRPPVLSDGPVCKVEGCNKSDKGSRGLCRGHYTRYRRGMAVDVPLRSYGRAA